MIYVTLSRDGRLRFWEEDVASIDWLWIVCFWGIDLVRPVQAFEWLPDE